MMCLQELKVNEAYVPVPSNPHLVRPVDAPPTGLSYEIMNADPAGKN